MIPTERFDDALGHAGRLHRAQGRNDLHRLPSWTTPDPHQEHCISIMTQVSSVGQEVRHTCS